MNSGAKKAINLTVTEGISKNGPDIRRIKHVKNIPVMVHVSIENTLASLFVLFFSVRVILILLEVNTQLFYGVLLGQELLNSLNEFDLSIER